jgi:DNA primase large subunit
MHQETSSLCAPVTLGGKPYIPEGLNAYRTLDTKLLGSIIRELKNREKFQDAKPNFGKIKKDGNVRPCILAALDRPLEGGNGHLMRLAVAREFLNAGYNVDEIIPLFKNQSDFKLEKTRYYVEHAAKNPTKPFTCRKIRELGYCLPNCGRGWEK